MEKIVRITSVNVLTKDKVGKTINRVAIALAGVQHPIYQGFDEFLRGLQNSGLIGTDVININHHQVVQLRADLIDGTARGIIREVKKDDKYLVTDESSIVTNSQHPLYGEYTTGDSAPVLSDKTIVDGFLTFKVDPKVDFARRQAVAYASVLFMDKVADAFEEPTSEPTPEPTPESNEPVKEPIPKGVINESIEDGSKPKVETPKAEKKETTTKK